MFANEPDPERHAQNIRLAAVQEARLNIGAGADVYELLTYARELERYWRYGSCGPRSEPHTLLHCDTHNAPCQRGCLNQCRDAMEWKDAYVAQTNAYVAQAIKDSSA